MVTGMIIIIVLANSNVSGIHSCHQKIYLELNLLFKEERAGWAQLSMSAIISGNPKPLMFVFHSLALTRLVSMAKY